MVAIGENDWSFEKIRASDADRADALEAARSPEELVAGLAETLAAAAAPADFRIAVDSIRNEFKELRAIVQFRVSPALYDWFFNARTGYRAQFWEGADLGMRFNERIIIAVRDVLHTKLPEMTQVRRIEVHVNEGARTERDAGVLELPRDKVLASFVPAASKIWIGERLYDSDGGAIDLIGSETLRKAEQSTAKLVVPSWAVAEKPEGLWAPLPEADCSWLDVKGGFVAADGSPTQCKPQDKRAKDIHKTGWT